MRRRLPKWPTVFRMDDTVFHSWPSDGASRTGRCPNVLLTRMKLFVLGALVLGCVGSVAFTQGPGGGGKRGGGMDPDAAFDRYAKGGNAIVVSEYETDERMAKFMPSETVREWMTAFLQEKGIKNGKLTREDYREYSEWVRPKMMEHFQKMREQGGGGGKGDRKDGGNKDGGNSPQSSEDLDGRA